jgi:acyl-coenzyme A thioesterase PaaI-like protein
MKMNTHLKIDEGLCGTVIAQAEGSASVVLETTDVMAADEQGLVHGGFIFGAADYAAMAAVNEPTVVLAGAECRFLAPSRVGDEIIMKANIIENDAKKYKVTVTGYCGDKEVFSGLFKTVVLPKHVLD